MRDRIASRIEWNSLSALWNNTISQNARSGLCVPCRTNALTAQKTSEIDMIQAADIIIAEFAPDDTAEDWQ